MRFVIESLLSECCLLVDRASPVRAVESHVPRNSLKLFVVALLLGALAVAAACWLAYWVAYYAGYSLS